MDDLLETYRAAQAARGKRPSADRLARVREKLEEGLLVADDEGRGFALGEQALDDDGAGDPLPGVLHVSMVFVHPDVQRQGLGSELVEALADAAWEQGFRSLSLWTSTPAFYEACGFEPSGRTREPDWVHLTAELEAPVHEVVVHDSAIRLGQLLKLAEMVESGSEAKELLATGTVEVNGEVEVRRGRQLEDGDEIRANDRAVRLVLAP